MQKKLDNQYWVNRLIKYGHTGFANPVVYYYDQKIRLTSVKRIIEDLLGNINSCLDYGCGTGDFSFMLSKINKKVTAYDIDEKIIENAQKKYPTSIRFTSDLNTVFSEKYDLILTVTVLQLLDKNTLDGILENFSSSLNINGYLIMLETINMKNNTLLGSDKGREYWFELLKANDFSLHKEHYFYHPTLSPTSTYLHYSKKLEVKTLGLLCRTKIGSKFFKNRLISIANKYAQQDFEYFQDNETPSILMVWKKNTE